MTGLGLADDGRELGLLFGSELDARDGNLYATYLSANDLAAGDAPRKSCCQRYPNASSVLVKKTSKTSKTSKNSTHLQMAPQPNFARIPLQIRHNDRIDSLVVCGQLAHACSPRPRMSPRFLATHAGGMAEWSMDNCQKQEQVEQ